MTIVKITIRIIGQLAAASILAFILSSVVWYTCSLCGVYLPATFYSTFLLGAPLGSVLGIYILERIVYKLRKIQLWGMIVGFWIGILGFVLVTFILPNNGLDLFEWSFALLGTRVDQPIFILSTSLFCVVGYNCTEFVFDKIRSTTYVTHLDKDKMVKSSEKGQRIITRRRMVFAALCVSIILVFLGIIFRSRIFNKEPKARAFLEQIIRSINEDTNLYKEEFRGVTWEKRTPWSYLDKVSDNYEILAVKSEFEEGHYYEYKIIFDNETIFHAAIADYGRRFALEVFEPESNL